MIEIETSLRRWGNSFGVIIPKEQVRRAGLVPDESLILYLKPRKSLRARDLYGKLSGWNGTTEAVMRAADEELGSKLGRE